MPIDKIYSRNRLKLKVKKIDKNDKIKLIIISVLLILVLFFLLLIQVVLPIFRTNCVSRANSIGVKIVNTAVSEVMKEYTYDDLIIINKNEKGDVTYLELNIVIANELISKITTSVQNAIDTSASNKVYINSGTLTGISELKSIGPSLAIDLETSGTIRAKIDTEFLSVGINQTMHRVFADISSVIRVTTPIGIFSENIETRVILTEAVIVAPVPDTYYHIDGVDNIDATEFIE